MRIHVLEGAGLDDHGGQRGRGHRVGEVDDGQCVLSPELPVNAVERAAKGFHDVAQRSGPVARTPDHARPGGARVAHMDKVFWHLSPIYGTGSPSPTLPARGGAPPLDPGLTSPCVTSI